MSWPGWSRKILQPKIVISCKGTASREEKGTGHCQLDWKREKAPAKRGRKRILNKSLLSLICLHVLYCPPLFFTAIKQPFPPHTYTYQVTQQNQGLIQHPLREKPQMVVCPWQSLGAKTKIWPLALWKCEDLGNFIARAWCCCCNVELRRLSQILTLSGSNKLCWKGHVTSHCNKSKASSHSVCH